MKCCECLFVPMPGPVGPTGSSGSIGPTGATSSMDCLTEITYAELLLLIAGNLLDPGCQYLIIDYQTIEIIPNTLVPVVGPIEPLIIKAATTNSIDQLAISQTFPSDEIYYEVFDSRIAPPPGNKGRIIYRIDVVSNVTFYDWRTIPFRRWELLGNFTSITDNGNAFIDRFTFNQVYVPGTFNLAPFCFNNRIGPITDVGITFLGAPIDLLNNTIFDGFAANNSLEEECFNNTLGNGGEPIADNELSLGFINNVIGDNMINNHTGLVFSDNTAGPNFIGNRIGFQCGLNQFGNNFANNVIGDNMFANTFGNDSAQNLIGGFFSNNLIEDQFLQNNIKSSFNSNFIGDSFSQNVIGDNFNTNGTLINPIINFIGNDIGNNFNNNNIDINFQDNVIGNDFSNNTIGAEFRTNHINAHTNNNVIGDFFNNNFINDFFQFNIIGGNSFGNQIGDNFRNNDITSLSDNQIGNDFNGIGVILAYSVLVGGPFTIGETITGGTSAAIGTLVTDEDDITLIGSMVLGVTVGTFVVGESITGSLSGATATVDLVVFGNLIRGNFTNNRIFNQFRSNSINYIQGDGMQDNDILNAFQQNIIGSGGSTFQKNHIETGLAGVNFAAATHVYGNYTFEIKLNLNSTYFGYYYNNVAPGPAVIVADLPDA